MGSAVTTVPFFLIDAFADKPFTGCPAAVCALEEWPEDTLLQSMSEEHNQSETAFIVPKGEDYELRWFTTTIGEIDLCGHATMAAAHAIFEHLDYVRDEIIFHTRFSGILRVTRSPQGLTLDLPAWPPEPIDTIPENAIRGCSNKTPIACLAKREYLLVYETEEDIRNITPDFAALAKLDKWVCITAPGKDCDFVSRFFCPGEPLEEDPVTGSAHSMLVPYWAERLGKTNFIAKQLSKRGGTLHCTLKGDRVLLTGHATTYAEGTVTLSTLAI